MGQFQSLSESEMEIMRVIWDADASITAAQLLELYGKNWNGYVQIYVGTSYRHLLIWDKGQVRN